ncbi:DUF4278 domain-containing protein [Leptolyngbya iicbica]|uniref:DUF4278 domain-containing protein n=2 Tax=Cyanophyceae TaxID=3028117 RepID=A0A4Q7ELR9_9CYAN|nr:DUF4278 domain-containing protein [Leptolyngbya sp. LK]RZM82749.1 DUF4278 domain-containing protein [Leptolyngbya sp. LK]
MKLSFLGQSYEASIHAVDAVETSETAIFLGQPYARKQYTNRQRQQPASELTYRGIKYTT